MPAAEPVPAWRARSSPFPVESVLSFHYDRRAAADDTLSWDGGTLAVPGCREGDTAAGR